MLISFLRVFNNSAWFARVISWSLKNTFPAVGSISLFKHLRTGKKSTIITSNLSFEKWDEIFNNTTLTAALVDRLTHKAYLVNMNGDSYRLRETKVIAKK